jgi:antitoxin MazE
MSSGHRAFDVDRDRSRDRAIEHIASFRKTLPPDWKFGRDEANAR